MKAFEKLEGAPEFVQLAPRTFKHVVKKEEEEVTELVSNTQNTPSLEPPITPEIVDNTPNPSADSNLNQSPLLTKFDVWLPLHVWEYIFQFLSPIDQLRIARVTFIT